MARQTREEWLESVMTGDPISFTPPGAELPIVGTLTRKIDGYDLMIGDFGDREYEFHGGALAGHPEVLLWMVATGKGGSVGPRIFVSNGSLAVEDTPSGS